MKEGGWFCGNSFTKFGQNRMGKRLKLNHETSRGLAYALNVPKDYLEAVCKGVSVEIPSALKFCPSCQMVGMVPESNWLDLRDKYRAKLKRSNRLRVFYALPTPIENPPYLQWYEDPRLRRYVQSLMNNTSAPSEASAIAQILVKRLETENPAGRDLCGCSTALLAELLLSGQRGIWIRLDMFEKLKKYDASIGLSDIYALGIGILCNPQAFVSGFAPDSNVNWYNRLRAWSSTKFRRSVVDRVRTVTGLRFFMRTNLGLLKRSTDTRVKEVLIAVGDRGDRLEGLLLLHQCLKETVEAGQFETQNPQPAHYAELLIQYNEYGGASILPIPNWQSLNELLTSMGTTLRSYEQPRIDSIDRPIGNAEAEQTTTQGEILTSTPENPFGAKRASESTTDGLSRLEVENCQKLAIDSLSPLTSEEQRLLMFLFGLRLNQAETGLEVGCHQANVFRRRNAILQKISHRLNSQLLTEQLTAQLLAETIGILTEVYEDYYSELLVEILTDVAKLHPPEQVCQGFIDRIQAHWQFEFDSGARGLVKVRAFVESRSRLWQSNISA